MVVGLGGVMLMMMVRIVCYDVYMLCVDVMFTIICVYAVWMVYYYYDAVLL